MTAFSQDFPHGITCIDTGYWRPGFAAAYLLIEGGEALFIETGPSHAVPRLRATLAHKGLSPEALRAILVTHVHLDHAGGAAELLNHLPEAQLRVHPRGLRHLLDPTQLQAGAEAVYGPERFQSLLGTVQPADSQRTKSTEDQEMVGWPGRPLTILHTPGHALHHQCIWDPTSGGLFTGDAFGISYRIFDQGEERLLFPATTPVQFDREASHHTLDRLAALSPKWLFLTHFGPVPFTNRLTDRLHTLLDRFADLADLHGAQKGPEPLTEALHQLLYQECPPALPPLSDALCRDWLAMDCALNAQGLRVWQQRRSC
ncbi:MAG: MBL fold metallo-hydrolase [Magnetococcales bacterium]|nr:MBL fold metallo-hydrolase [Magnetococcales bacterium]